jgi:protein ImuA
MRQQASPAPLRLWLQARGDVLQVHVLKRRGPPLEQPVALPARGERLAAALQAQAWRRRQAQMAAWGMAPPREESHVLAGLALAAGR